MTTISGHLIAELVVMWRKRADVKSPWDDGTPSTAYLLGWDAAHQRCADELEHVLRAIHEWETPETEER